MRAFILVHGVLEDLLQCKVSMCKSCMFVQCNTYCVLSVCDMPLYTRWQGWGLECIQKILLEGLGRFVPLVMA